MNIIITSSSHAVQAMETQVCQKFPAHFCMAHLHLTLPEMKKTEKYLPTKKKIELNSQTFF
jgi:hypothetical protein